MEFDRQCSTERRHDPLTIMDGTGRSISVRSGEIRLCRFFLIFGTDLPVCNSLSEQDRMITNCKDGITHQRAMSLWLTMMMMRMMGMMDDEFCVYLQLCFTIGFICCSCGELTASRCVFRERVV